MGTFRLSKDFIDYDVVAQTSESGGFFAVNLQDRAHPKRAWRTTGIAGEEYVVCDLGDVYTDVEIHVEVANFTKFNLYVSEDDVSYSQYGGDFIIERDQKQGVYRFGATLNGLNARYVVFIIPAQATTDGASYFSLGTLSFLASTELLATNPNIPLSYSENGTDGFVVNDFDSGGYEVLDLAGGLRPLSITLNLRPRFSSDDPKVIWDIFRSKEDIVYINFGLGKSWQAYLVRRRSPIGDARDSFSYVRFESLNVALVV